MVEGLKERGTGKGSNEISFDRGQFYRPGLQEAHVEQTEKVDANGKLDVLYVKGKETLMNLV